ncbi:hypothetical protein [Pseudomonas putida]|uniref:Peptidase M41 domain-containing protein n=1 Tax=Pseudomonas putida TaxID=303 RepID=A0A8I1EFG9_PSEPU|nr:hypothetical protein [Pseudomonas putida]MBI6885102.1 hypothetical protein [Pseudomonas putida]
MALPKVRGARDESRVIHHELGHWLMAREVGFDTGGVIVQRAPDGAIHGSAKVFPRASVMLDTTGAIDDYLTRRVMVLCTGVIVEIEWYSKNLGRLLDEDELADVYENGVIDVSGLSDKGKIEELLVILSGLRNKPVSELPDFAAQISDLFTEIYNQAKVKAEKFLDKLYVMAEITSKEKWQSREMLEVPLERLLEIESLSETRLKMMSPAI